MANKVKRQSSLTAGTNYIVFNGGVGQLVTDKNDAAAFAINDGALFSAGNYIGASSADLSAGFGAMSLSSTPPQIDTTWSVPMGGSATFSNDAFSYGGGSAVFCAAQDNTVYIQYTAAADNDCTQVHLSVESAGMSLLPKHVTC